MNKILGFLLIFSFVSALNLKVEAFDIVSNEQETKLSASEQQVTQPLVHSTESQDQDCNDCDDCNDHQCSDEGDCCKRLCACTSLLFMASQEKATQLSSFLLSELQWFFYRNYNAPLLSPSLRPPRYS